MISALSSRNPEVAKLETSSVAMFWCAKGLAELPLSAASKAKYIDQNLSVDVIKSALFTGFHLVYLLGGDLLTT